MSAKVVVPLRIISANARREPQRTKSSVTFFASAGKMYLRSQSSRVTSSIRPRINTIGMWVCPLIRPGMMSFPLASMLRLARISFPATLWESGALLMNEMLSPFTPITPFSMTCLSGSMVTIVAFVTTRSNPADSCDCAKAKCGEINSSTVAKPQWGMPTDIRGNEMTLMSVSFRRLLLQIRRVERFRKELAHPERLDFSLQVRHDDGYIAAKFPDQLATSAAR